MSIKVQNFAKIITNPLNVHNFVVKIEGVVLGFDLLVRSTTFPSEEKRVVVLHVAGEEVRYPTIPKNNGSWAFQIPENDDGKIYQIFKNLSDEIYDQKTGQIKSTSLKDIEIFARDLQDNVVFSTVLKGAWIQSRGEVALSNQDPAQNWNWDFKFVYQWIQDNEPKK